MEAHVDEVSAACVQRVNKKVEKVFGNASSTQVDNSVCDFSNLQFESLPRF